MSNNNGFKSLAKKTSLSTFEENTTQNIETKSQSLSGISVDRNDGLIGGNGWRSTSVLTPYNNHINSYLSSNSSSLQSLMNYSNDNTLSILGDKKMNISTDIPIYEEQDYLNENMHLSKLRCVVIQRIIVFILDLILEQNEIKIDYSVSRKNKYQIKGRVFTNNSSEFNINICKLKQKDSNGNLAVIEIKKLSGNAFGFYKFEDAFLELCQQKKVISKIRKTSDSFASSLSMDSFPSLNLEIDDDEMNNSDTVSMVSDTTSSIQDNEQFDIDLCSNLLQTLYNSESYRDEYQHDAYTLFKYLQVKDKRSKTMLNYLLKNESSNLIENIMSPIKPLFDPFIILNVLQTINFLLSDKETKSQFKIPNSFKSDIQKLNKTWTSESGVTNVLGPIQINFIKSQQIEKVCQSILRAL